MKLIQRLFLRTVALAMSAPAIGALLQGAWPAGLGLSAIAALWLNARRWRWLNGLSFALYIAGSAIMVGLGVGMGWLLVGVTAALAAWDLEAFGARLASVERVENEHALMRTHLQRLGLVCAGGLLLGAGASLIRLQLRFGGALLLALLAVLGLGYVLRSIGESGQRRNTQS